MLTVTTTRTRACRCVTVRSGPSHAVIALAGELDLATVPHLSPVLHGLLSEGRTQITINLDAVTFMDVCALGALLVAHRDVTRAKGPWTSRA